MNKLSEQDIEELKEFLTLGACEYSGIEEVVSDLVYETLQKFPTTCYYADEIGLIDSEEEFEVFAVLDEFISIFWNKAVEKILNVISIQ